MEKLQRQKLPHWWQRADIGTCIEGYKWQNDAIKQIKTSQGFWGLNMRQICSQDRVQRGSETNPEKSRQQEVKNLDGLIELLAHGRTECRMSSTTSLKREPNNNEVGESNWYIAKFVTREERNTEPAPYSLSRPAKVTKKTVQQKIALHKQDLIKKLHAAKKVKGS